MQADPHAHLARPGPAEGPRLALLHTLDWPAAPAPEPLQDLVRAIRLACGRATAMLTLVDADEARHVVCDGAPVAEATPRELAFCSHAILGQDLYEVADLSVDPRFAQHPLVREPGGPRHYAAMPLRLEGHALGTLCVLDPAPGALAPDGRETLRALATVATHLLASRLSERRQATQLDRLVDLVRAAGDWAWELDEHGRYTWLDGGLQTTTGFQPTDWLGRAPDAEVLLDSAGQPLPQGGTLLDLLARREPFARVLSRLETPRGWLTISRSAQPVFDLRGRFRGFRGSARDVSASLERESLVRDRAALETVQRGRSHFLSRVSHELRTPLNAVLGFAQLMALDARHPLPPEQSQRLEGLQRSGRHLLALVDDVLEVVHLGQGQQALKTRALSVHDATRQAWARLQGAAEAHGVRLSLDIDPALRVSADPRGLDQVLSQLLSNAIKYNRPGGRIEVRAATVGAAVRLSVHDQGPGLGPHELSQLFQPFERGAADRRRVPGTGLGLVLVREWVGAMNGRVEASSPPGEGCCFTVELPPAPPAGQRPASADRALAVAEAPPRRVLYIEDEPLNVVLMQEIFRARPEWVLEVARDGESGVAQAQAACPDLALVDMNLPDFPGTEVLRRLRADPRTRDLHCIALSADAMADQIQAARDAGFADYWTKPIDLGRLLDAVAKALEQGHASA